MLKILCFSSGHQILQMSPGESLFTFGIVNLFIYWPGRHNLGPGKQIQQIYRPGKTPGRFSPGHLDRVCLYLICDYDNFFIRISISSITYKLEGERVTKFKGYKTSFCLYKQLLFYYCYYQFIYSR